jgi:hypothetical protein
LNAIYGNVQNRFQIGSTANSTIWYKIGTLGTPTAVGTSQAQLIYTVNAGFNFGGNYPPKDIVYFGTRSTINLNVRSVYGGNQITYGYVTNGSNVELWAKCPVYIANCWITVDACDGVNASYGNLGNQSTEPTGITYVTTINEYDDRYLQLTGGTLSGPGNLNVAGTIQTNATGTAISAPNGGITAAGTIEANSPGTYGGIPSLYVPYYPPNGSGNYGLQIGQTSDLGSGSYAGIGIGVQSGRGGNAIQVSSGGSVLMYVASTGAISTNATGTAISAPNGGATIKGYTDNSSAASGIVGEYIETVIPDASQVSVVNNTAKSIMSVSLTAGDWDIEGGLIIFYNEATVVGNSVIVANITSTTNTITNNGRESVILIPALSVVSTETGIVCPRQRVSITSTTTYYLVAQVPFTAGSAACAGQLTARRIR